MHASHTAAVVADILEESRPHNNEKYASIRSNRTGKSMVYRRRNSKGGPFKETALVEIWLENQQRWVQLGAENKALIDDGRNEYSFMLLPQSFWGVELLPRSAKKLLLVYTMRESIRDSSRVDIWYGNTLDSVS